MTTKNDRDVKVDPPSSSTTKARGKKPRPITRFARRYALLATVLALAASVAPLFSTAASAAQAPISPQSTAPVISYGGGLATTVVDENHDVLLFTQASGVTIWAEQTIATAARAKDYFDPEIASDGAGDLLIVALDGDGHLWSWRGRVGAKFHRTSVSGVSTYSTPSVAYSPAGGIFVVVATDSDHNVDFFFQSGGGWSSVLVVSGQNVPFIAAVTAVTDTGIVVVATDNQGEMDAFYRPSFALGFTLTSTLPGGYVDPSAVWSGTDVFVAVDQAGAKFGDQSLHVLSYSDQGVFVSNTLLGESTGTDELAGSAIVWSGFNVGVVSEDAGDGELNFFYSDSSFVFHFEQVALNTAKRGYGFFPGIAMANDSIEITDVSNADLYGFSQPIGGTGWPLQVIAK
jgi:hypothetical protein